MVEDTDCVVVGRCSKEACREVIAHLLNERVLVPSYYKLVLAGSCALTCGEKESLSTLSETRRKKPLSWNHHIIPLALPAAQTILCLQPSRNGKEEIADRKTAQKLPSCVETKLLLVSP